MSSSKVLKLLLRVIANSFPTCLIPKENINLSKATEELFSIALNKFSTLFLPQPSYWYKFILFETCFLFNKKISSVFLIIPFSIRNLICFSPNPSIFSACLETKWEILYMICSSQKSKLMQRSATSFSAFINFWLQID